MIADIPVKAKPPPEAWQVFNSMIEDEYSKHAEDNTFFFTLAINASGFVRENEARAKRLATSVRYRNVEVGYEEICRHILAGLPSDHDYVRKDSTLQGLLPLDDLERGLVNAEELSKSNGTDNRDTLAAGFKSRGGSQGGRGGGCGGRNGGEVGAAAAAASAMIKVASRNSSSNHSISIISNNINRCSSTNSNSSSRRYHSSRSHSTICYNDIITGTPKDVGRHQFATSAANLGILPPGATCLTVRGQLRPTCELFVVLLGLRIYVWGRTFPFTISASFRTA